MFLRIRYAAAVLRGDDASQARALYLAKTRRFRAIRATVLKGSVSWILAPFSRMKQKISEKIKSKIIHPIKSKLLEGQALVKKLASVVLSIFILGALIKLLRKLFGWD